MNQEQTTLLAACERRVSPLKNMSQELLSFGGKPPLAALKEYDRMRAEAISLDLEIQEMLPPKKGDEKKVLDAMQRLQMLVDSVATLTDVLESEVRQAKVNFLKKESEAIHVSAMQGEAKAEEQVITAMKGLIKALHTLWSFAEKRFLLER
jgi:hypothetical protein